MKKLIYHVGLHKTGTTALQKTLFNSEKLLDDIHLSYPRVGIESGFGHANIAWELLEDRRYRAPTGSAYDLRNQILNSDKDIVLSAEDFSSILHRTDKLEQLFGYAATCNRQPVIVLYLRNQISYFESLYIELASLGNDPQSLIEEITYTKAIHRMEWAFHFDYLNIAKNLWSIFGKEHTHIRLYDQIENKDVVKDFLGIIRPDFDASRLSRSSINKRHDMTKVLNDFIVGRIQESSANHAKSNDYLKALRALLQSYPIALSNPNRQRLINLFASGNQQLCQHLGQDPKSLELNVNKQFPMIPLESLYSHQTCIDIISSAFSDIPNNTLANNYIQQAVVQNDN